MEGNKEEEEEVRVTFIVPADSQYGEISAAEIWEPTYGIRWNNKVLEQCWRNNLGEIKWEVVPSVIT